MSDSIQPYAHLIQTWQTHEPDKLEALSVDKILLPLKLMLLNRSNEAKELIQLIDFQTLSDCEKAFVLEAKLFDAPYVPVTSENLDMAKYIIALFDRAFIANITLANHSLIEKQLPEAISCYEKALSISPNSEKLINELTYLCLYGQKPKEMRVFQAQLKDHTNQFFSRLGMFGLSTTYQKIALGVILAVISLAYPYAVYLFAFLILLFAISLQFGIRKKNRLVVFVSTGYIFFLLAWSVMSYLFHFLY